MAGTRDRQALAASYGPLALVLAAGLLVRLWALRFPPFQIDINAWIAWGNRLLAVGPANFYSEDVFADYAPGYLYVTGLLAAMRGLFSPDAPAGLDYALFRLPAIVSDLVTGWLLFVAVRHSTSDTASATLAAGCHVFSPAIVFNSAVWGQIDGVFTLLIVASLVLLLRDRAGWAVVCYVLAFMVKPQSIAVAPLIGLYLLLRYPPRRWPAFAAIGLATGFAVLVPFFGLRSYIGLLELLTGSVEVYPYTSLFTYNVWGIYGMWRDDTELGLGGLPLRSIGNLLYLAGLLLGLVLLWLRLRRSRDDAATVWGFATFFAFLPVMVLTRMHERYLYPVLPLLLVFALVWPRPVAGVAPGRPGKAGGLAALRRPLLWLWAGLSLLHALNLYQVYIYYLYRITYDEQPVPPSNWLYFFVDRQPKLWSALTLAVFVAVSAYPVL